MVNIASILDLEQTIYGFEIDSIFKEIKELFFLPFPDMREIQNDPHFFVHHTIMSFTFATTFDGITRRWSEMLYFACKACIHRIVPEVATSRVNDVLPCSPINPSECPHVATALGRAYRALSIGCRLRCGRDSFQRLLQDPAL